MVDKGDNKKEDDNDDDTIVEYVLLLPLLFSFIKGYEFRRIIPPWVYRSCSFVVADTVGRGGDSSEPFIFLLCIVWFIRRETKTGGGEVKLIQVIEEEEEEEIEGTGKDKGNTVLFVDNCSASNANGDGFEETPSVVGKIKLLSFVEFIVVVSSSSLLLLLFFGSVVEVEFDVVIDEGNTKPKPNLYNSLFLGP